MVAAPALCVADAGFAAQGGWGRSPYMPWAPLYGILNVAMNKGEGTPWWRENNATTLVDWVKCVCWFCAEKPCAAHALTPRADAPFSLQVLAVCARCRHVSGVRGGYNVFAPRAT